jgi:benzoate-CoA ligase
MTELSRIRAGVAPPHVELPRSYNAAVDLLDRHVLEGRGDRIAVIDDDGHYTYRDLAARADRAAGALRDLGVQPEQRVALVLLDGIDFPAAFLGAIKLGAVPVPLNTMLTPEDYTYMLRDSPSGTSCGRPRGRARRRFRPASTAARPRETSARDRRAAGAGTRTTR